ncbi:MAG: hypothetical protein GY711_33035 [bacterium]|nr:hypothetical protein [bacterium]
MAKTVVIVGEGEPAPFLRGILTRSLQDAGLSFDDAYGLATTVRDELRDVDELSTDELRERVVKYLVEFGDSFVDRFMRPEMPTILVRASSGETAPYSRGRQRMHLEACGLGPAEAIELAAGIQDGLMARGRDEVSSLDLKRLTHQYLETQHGADAAHRYLVWEEFLAKGDPLLILLGGATGCGKSTVAAHVAHQLEIVRTQPTDMIREVMRMMMPKKLLPVLHTSTFLAHSELHSREGSSEDADTRLANGYLTQAGLISVGCQAVVARAVSERVSLILEGIHVHPEWMVRVAKESPDVIVTPIMLGVLRPEVLRARLVGRGHEAPGRRARRYLKHFDEIWSLQSFLLSEADRCGVAIVPNGDRERAVQRVLGSVMQVLSGRYKGTPKRVLGEESGP